MATALSSSASTTTEPGFIGYLVSIETKKNVFYQGVVQNISANKNVIQLTNCFQNGFQCGNKIIEIKTPDIENIEILADPQSALDILKPRRFLSSPSNSSSSSSSSSAVINTNKQQQQKINDTSTTSTGSSIDAPSKAKRSQTMGHISESHGKSKHNHHHHHGDKRDKQHHHHHHHKHHNHHHRHQQNGTAGSSDDEENSSSHNQRHHHNSRSVINDKISGVTVESVQDDFDFEKNLALFNKQAFYDEISDSTNKTTSSMSESEAMVTKPPVASVNILDFIKTTKNNDDTLVKKFENLTTASTTVVPLTSAQHAQRYHPISIANLFGIATENSKANSNAAISVVASAASTVQINQPAAPNGNYRYDENVLATGEPVPLQQIELPCKQQRSYVTDDGLIVPCVDVELRRRIYDVSLRHGFTKQRHAESMARSCAEMILQLLGGPLRFSPKNSHQRPTILVLANGGELQGIYAVSTARLLSTRGVKISLFVHNANSDDCFKNELNLLSDDAPSLTLVENVDDLKKLHVDLVINGLDSHTSSLLSGQAWYRTLVRHIVDMSGKTSVLALDPPPDGSAIPSKWCIVPVLPMSMSRNCGRVYLADLGLTKKVFQAVNIKYQSPFGAKFIIPLHTD